MNIYLILIILILVVLNITLYVNNILLNRKNKQILKELNCLNDIIEKQKV